MFSQGGGVLPSHNAIGQEDTPPPPPRGYGQPPGGTHPTGMHTCFRRHLFSGQAEAKPKKIKEKTTNFEDNFAVASTFTSV